MAGEAQDSVWPLPKFYFSVQLGDDKDFSFQEVSGLDAEGLHGRRDLSRPGNLGKGSQHVGCPHTRG